MKSIIIYDSLGGNTDKAARTIHQALQTEGLLPDILKVDKETHVELLDYDLIFIGSPVIDWLPTKKMMAFVKKELKQLNKQKEQIKPAAPILPGKFGVCFGTFAGPHIGKKEALPMTMWLRSALEHIGFIVLDTWHVVGAFNNGIDLNHNGRLGNIENRPNQNDLDNLSNRVKGITAALQAWRN